MKFFFAKGKNVFTAPKDKYIRVFYSATPFEQSLLKKYMYFKFVFSINFEKASYFDQMM